MKQLRLPILLSIAAALATLALKTAAWYLTGSDGHHLMADVWTCVGILGGLGLVALTHWSWIDPVFGILVGLYILRTAFGLVRRSFDGLMDRALTDAEQGQLRTTISAALEPGT